jgi:ribosome-associated protein
VILPVTRVADKSCGNGYAVLSDKLPFQTMHETDHDDQYEISKTQRKRELQELKRLGEVLLDFSDDSLRQLMLPEVLLDALRTARKIHSNSARKRQLQYIGKLLKEIDITPVRQAIENRERQHDMHSREFHLLESLREQLLTDSEDALPAVLAHFPHADRQHLRKLASQSRRERDTGQPPRAYRLLFRYLRDLQQQEQF